MPAVSSPKNAIFSRCTNWLWAVFSSPSDCSRALRARSCWRAWRASNNASSSSPATPASKAKVR